MSKLKSIKLKVFLHIIHVGYGINKEEFREDRLDKWVKNNHDKNWKYFSYGKSNSEMLNNRLELTTAYKRKNKI